MGWIPSPKLLTVVQFRHFGIQPLEFYPGIFSSEAPIHSCLTFVTLILPGFDLLSQGVLIRDATIQTLTAQYAEFNFCHIQPATVLWCVMKLQLVNDSAGFFW